MTLLRLKVRLRGQHDSRGRARSCDHRRTPRLSSRRRRGHCAGKAALLGIGVHPAVRRLLDNSLGWQVQSVNVEQDRTAVPPPPRSSGGRRKCRRRSWLRAEQSHPRRHEVGEDPGDRRNSDARGATGDCSARSRCNIFVTLRRFGPGLERYAHPLGRIEAVWRLVVVRDGFGAGVYAPPSSVFSLWPVLLTATLSTTELDDGYCPLDPAP
jgi:hypothetical protein